MSNLNRQRVQSKDVRWKRKLGECYSMSFTWFFFFDTQTRWIKLMKPKPGDDKRAHPLRTPTAPVRSYASFTPPPPPPRATATSPWNSLNGSLASTRGPALASRSRDVVGESPRRRSWRTCLAGQTDGPTTAGRSCRTRSRKASLVPLLTLSAPVARSSLFRGKRVRFVSCRCCRPASGPTTTDGRAVNRTKSRLPAARTVRLLTNDDGRPSRKILRVCPVSGPGARPVSGDPLDGSLFSNETSFAAGTVRNGSVWVEARDSDETVEKSECRGGSTNRAEKEPGWRLLGNVCDGTWTRRSVG